MKNKGQNKRIALWIVLSVLVHMLSFYFKFNFTSNDTSKKIAVDFINPDQLDQIKRNIEVQNQLSKKQQIVNTEKTGEQKKPKNARFLGESDHSVERETIAKKIESFNTAGKGVTTKETDTTEKKSPSKEKKVSPQKLALSDLGVGNVNLADSESKSDEISKEKPGLESGNEKSRGVASNNDYITDLPLGDKTSLNTVEYKYFGFYNRIRLKLEQYWGKSLREKAKNLYEKGRKLASEEDYITSVKLTLDEKGNIVHIKILGSSGIQELDDAAVESFNKAGPFPNPPKGMIQNGITTIEWGFVVRS